MPASGGIPRARALLANHPKYSDLSPTQYATAFSLLRDLGVSLTAEFSARPENVVLGAIFEHAPPQWVQDADRLVQSPDELPSDITSAGQALGLDIDEVYRQLFVSWGKVDTASRERVGAAGEAALVALLRGRTHGLVEHVSELSDGFGYDVAFSDESVVAHLEVKSTTRKGRFTAYLSRHEFNVMLRDRHWALIAVHLTESLAIAGVGAVPRDWIAANIPRDMGASGTWASCKLEVPADVIEDQVGQLGERAMRALPPWRRRTEQDGSEAAPRFFVDGTG